MKMMLAENIRTFRKERSRQEQGTVPKIGLGPVPCFTAVMECGKIFADVTRICPQRREKQRIPVSVMF